MLGESNKKEPPFRVPEDYFRDLNTRIMNVLPDDNQSVLDSMNKENPFGVPENYFLDFNTRIMGVMSEKSEITDKQNPFNIPKGYFQDFNSRIMEVLPEKEKQQLTTKKPLWKRITPWVAVAAVFTGILITTGFLDINPIDKGGKNQVTDNISVNDEADDFYLFLSDQVAESAIYSDSFYTE